MNATALLVLLAAAVLHAGWNLLVKQAHEKYVFTWWALLAGAVLFSPVFFLGAPLPVRVWPYAFASALCETCYFVALITAYRLADFSLVYPLARGSAPALMTIGAIVWLREDLSFQGLLGLSALILGLLLVGSTARQDGGGSKGRPGARLFVALAVAVLIALYTLIDGAAVRFVSPARYNALIFIMTALFVTPVVLVRYGRQELVAELQSQWPRILTVGVLNVLSYALVLYAYTRAPVAYAGAVREVSIVFAALAGWWLLGEPMGRLRLLGAMLICAGIAFIALAG